MQNTLPHRNACVQCLIKSLVYFYAAKKIRSQNDIWQLFGIYVWVSNYLDMSIAEIYNANRFLLGSIIEIPIYLYKHL